MSEKNAHLGAVSDDKWAAWNVFECPSEDKHRLLRHKDEAPQCNRCDPPTDFKKIASVERNKGESEIDWKIRALRVKK